MLNSADLARYSRQITLPEFGLEGQRRLSQSSVLIVGAGGLGSPVALYLAAAGVGRLGIVDADKVELSNLHRQILHTTADVGRDKAASAAAAIGRLNPGIRVDAIVQRLNASSAADLIAGYDLVVDGSDNYPTRYAINDACAASGKPWVYGSVERFSGQVALFGAAGGPCYRCLYPEPPAPGSTASCEEIGVLGAVPGVIGSLQAVEALKWIAGIGPQLGGRLLQFDLLNGQIRVVGVDRDPTCKACGDGARSVSAPRVISTQLLRDDIEPADLSRLLTGPNAPVLLDVRERWEWSVARITSATLMPLSELEDGVAKLDRERPMVVYCHHGSRSAVAAQWLRAQGFQASNLTGGIDRWSSEVDPTIARY
jgi:molybdopterin/thiamine biosynthesis adenylyltransferase/rhodanese-related sulfurtransferase